MPARTPKRLRRQVEDVVGRIALGSLRCRRHVRLNAFCRMQKAARWKRAVPTFQRLRLRETMGSLGSARILRAVPASCRERPCGKRCRFGKACVGQEGLECERRMWALAGGEGFEDITRGAKAAVPARTPKRLRRQVEDVVGRIALGRLTMLEHARLNGKLGERRRPSCCKGGSPAAQCASPTSSPYRSDH